MKQIIIFPAMLTIKCVVNFFPLTHRTTQWRRIFQYVIRVANTITIYFKLMKSRDDTIMKQFKEKKKCICSIVYRMRVCKFM